MEQKLAKFRESKRSESQGTRESSIASGLAKRLSGNTGNKEDTQTGPTEKLKDEQVEPSDTPASQSTLRLTSLRLAAFCLWTVTLYVLACFELAGPFFLVSAAVAVIYFGTSSGTTRKKTELSAYSVFNPNCVRLKGTLTAEQFENEILRRPLDSGESS